MSWLTAYWQTLSPLEQVLYVLLMCAAELWWLRRWFPLPGSRAKRAARERAVTVARFSGEADRRAVRTRLQADVSQRTRHATAERCAKYGHSVRWPDTHCECGVTQISWTSTGATGTESTMTLVAKNGR